MFFFFFGHIWSVDQFEAGSNETGETTVSRYMESCRLQAAHLHDCKAINSFYCVLLVWETTCEYVQHEINYYWLSWLKQWMFVWLHWKQKHQLVFCCIPYKVATQQLVTAVFSWPTVTTGTTVSPNQRKTTDPSNFLSLCCPCQVIHSISDGVND